MKRFAKPMTHIPIMRPEDTVLSDISIAKLIDKGLLALSREIHNLTARSASGKLDAADARDLRDHLKLLFELRDREEQSLRSMSDDELKGLAQNALKDNIEQSGPE